MTVGMQEGWKMKVLKFFLKRGIHWRFPGLKVGKSELDPSP